MSNFEFMHPEFFWLFALLPLVAFWLWYTRNRQHAALQMSRGSDFQVGKLWRWMPVFLWVLRLAALALFIIGLARPRSVDVSSKTKSNKGIDIVMAVDVSASMLARDLKPNRLEALKKVATEFVSNRPNDRIGLVVYTADAYTKTPLTSDKAILEHQLLTIKYDRLLKDGTGIGMGLATAINRVKDSKAKSKVIILMTDGVNNSGFIEPELATSIAQEYGIKVYTIGIGTQGMAEAPYAIAPNGSFLYRQMPVEIDEKLLQSIAQKTAGKYFRATSNTSLKSIYDEINQLETTEIEELRFYDYQEHFRWFVLAGLMLFLLELVLRQTLFKNIVQ